MTTHKLHTALELQDIAEQAVEDHLKFCHPFLSAHYNHCKVNDITNPAEVKFVKTSMENLVGTTYGSL